jgi:hypothetical protein
LVQVEDAPFLMSVVIRPRNKAGLLDTTVFGFAMAPLSELEVNDGRHLRVRPWRFWLLEDVGGGSKFAWTGEIVKLMVRRADRAVEAVRLAPLTRTAALFKSWEKAGPLLSGILLDELRAGTADAKALCAFLALPRVVEIAEEAGG